MGVRWQLQMGEICWRTWCFWNAFSCFEISGNRGRTGQIEDSWMNTFPPSVLYFFSLSVSQWDNWIVACGCCNLCSSTVWEGRAGWSRCQVQASAVKLKSKCNRVQHWGGKKPKKIRKKSKENTGPYELYELPCSWIIDLLRCVCLDDWQRG